VDERGYYWYCGRTDETLKVGGIFVSPTEIENCLLEHEAVRECAVIGTNDKDNLIKPKAFVVLAEGFTASDKLQSELKEYVKSRLAAYKYPRWIEFRDELPKNDRGKIDRKALKPTSAETGEAVAHLRSPRLARPNQSADFEKEVVVEKSHQ
jgi:benzoate-CoA ligase